MTAPHPLAIFAWDGTRHLAFLLDPAAGKAQGALIAHTASAQQLFALHDSDAGPCVVALPDGCRHVELQILRGGLPAQAVAVELDDLLLPDLVEAGLAGLMRIRCASQGGSLSLSAEDADEPAFGGAQHALNLAQSGTAAFSRCRVGPLVDLAGRRIGVSAVLHPGAVALSFAARGPAPFVAQVFGPSAVRDAAAFDAPDASDAPPETFLRRGFRILSPAPCSSGSPRLEAAPFGPDDALIVYAPRGHQVVWRDGEDEARGSRLFLSRADDGSWLARAVSVAYRPATSTAMAALGGGGALALQQGGGAATVEIADAAADIAAALWQRARRMHAQPQPSILADAAQKAGVAPDVDGLSPVVAGLGPDFGLAPHVLEEIDALPAQDRLALVLWFAQDSAIAANAVRARVNLPAPAAAPPQERVRQLLAWTAGPDLRDRLERAAGRLAGQPRESARTLRQVAEALGDSWIELAALAAAESLLRQNPDPAAGGSGGATAELLARLRDDPQAAAALAESRDLDLGRLAEWRSGLVGDAAEAGLSDELRTDLARRLEGPASAEILLLHRNFRSTIDRQRRISAIRDAVDALDVAAGNDRLAQRIDRSGDPLLGMTRLGSASMAAVRELTRIPAARDALLALEAWIESRAPAAADDPLAAQLRRHLQGYGCLLLMQAIVRECDAAFPPGEHGSDSGLASSNLAWRRRLRGGVVEMLPAYVRAASAAMPDDAPLGATLIEALPTSSATAGAAAS